MVKANTPGNNDGEVKYWIDGNVVGDFPNLNMRSSSTLKIDIAQIGLHALHSERVNKKWYDNVVVATQYIGPMDERLTYSVTNTSANGAPSKHFQPITDSNWKQCRNRRVRGRRNRGKESVDPRFGPDPGAV